MPGMVALEVIPMTDTILSPRMVTQFMQVGMPVSALISALIRMATFPSIITARADLMSLTPTM